MLKINRDLIVLYGFKTNIEEYAPVDNDGDVILDHDIMNLHSHEIDANTGKIDWEINPRLLIIEDEMMGEYEYIGVPLYYQSDIDIDFYPTISLTNPQMHELNSILYDTLSRYSYSIPYTMHPALHIIIHTY